MIFWSLVMVDVLVARRGRGCATLTSSTPAAALVEPQLTPTVRLSRDFCTSSSRTGPRRLHRAPPHHPSPLPPSARRCYRAAPDSPNAWPYERGRVKLLFRPLAQPGWLRLPSKKHSKRLSPHGSSQ